MAHEQCSYLEPLTGLLYRASEYLSQAKLLTHLSGYLSRMDYVAHLNMESMLSSLVPYHTGSSRSSSSLLSHICCLANHILNICCSIGDTGCISFILWGFDDREALFLEFERCYGARLHLQIDLEGLSSTDSNSGLTNISQLVANRFDSLTDLLALRFNTARLLSTIPIDSNLSLISSITGPILQGSGSVMDSRSQSISYSRSAISVSHGGTGSCSLVRLFVRPHSSIVTLADEANKVTILLTLSVIVTAVNTFRCSSLSVLSLFFALALLTNGLLTPSIGLLSTIFTSIALQAVLVTWSLSAYSFANSEVLTSTLFYTGLSRLTSVWFLCFAALLLVLKYIAQVLSFVYVLSNYRFSDLIQQDRSITFREVGLIWTTSVKSLYDIPSRLPLTVHTYAHTPERLSVKTIAPTYTHSRDLPISL